MEHNLGRFWAEIGHLRQRVALGNDAVNPRSIEVRSLTNVRQALVYLTAATALQQRKQGRARSASLLATIHSRAREICGILSCTSMHFQALSCNGRLPRS